MNKFFILFIFLFSIVGRAFAQTDTTAHTPPSIAVSSPQLPFNKKRLALVVSTESALYAGSMIGLNELWYKDYPRSSFHFFDDNQEWMQMDKCGHLTTAYYIGRVGIDMMKWSGVERKKAIWYGGMVGSVYQSTIEVLDGFSSEWGFSLGDFTANTLGSLMVVGQQLAWNDQRMVLKFSFQPSVYAPYRPNVLGKDLQENILKDYNGQTYWLSVNPAAFMSHQTRFPKWLNIAVGYGAEGMTGAFANPLYIDASGTPVNFERYRQFYLSFDIDLTRIKSKSTLLNTIFNTIGFIKIPAPSLEFSKNGISGNLIGF